MSLLYVIFIAGEFIMNKDDKIYTECGTYTINTAGANGHPTKFAHTQWANILSRFITRNIL